MKPLLPLATVALSVLVACSSGPKTKPQYSQIVPRKSTAYTKNIAQTRDNLNTAQAVMTAKPGTRVNATMPRMPKGANISGSIKGLGFAQVSGQPAKQLNERRLLAIRAARLEAMRDLTEQVYGIHLTSNSTVRSAALTNDVIDAKIKGVLRGARTVRISPKDDDTFEVILELDQSTIAYIVRAALKGM